MPTGETVVFKAYGLDPVDQVNANANYMGLNNNLVDNDETGIVLDIIDTAVAVGIEVEFVGGGSNRIVNWIAYAEDDVTQINTGTLDNGTAKHGVIQIDAGGAVVGR